MYKAECIHMYEIPRIHFIFKNIYLFLSFFKYYFTQN